MRKKISISCIILFVSGVMGCGFVKQPAPAPILVKSHISGKVVYSAIVNNSPFTGQIFLKDLDTGKVVQLTYTESNFNPEWSPDGTQIIFTKSTKQNSNDVYIMEKDGSNQRALIATSANEALATWSPDGKRIAFESLINGKSEIYTMDLVTRVLVKLTNSSKFAGLPAWSPSSNKIAFQSSSGGAGRSQIFIMNADGTNIEQVTNYDIDNFDGIPAWCLDDSCVIFSRHEKGVDKLMLLDLKRKESFSLLDGVFDAKSIITRIGRSSLRGYITFSADGTFYAMDVNSREIYSLGVDALDLSLYP